MSTNNIIPKVKKHIIKRFIDAEDGTLGNPQGNITISLSSGNFLIQLKCITTNGGQYKVSWPDGTNSLNNSNSVAGNTFAGGGTKSIKVEAVGATDSISQIDLGNNNIHTYVTAVDITKLTKIKEIFFQTCTQLTTLDITNNPLLDIINVGSTGITTLATAGLVNLVVLTLGNNMTSINVTGCVALTTLNIGGATALTSISGLSTTLVTGLSMNVMPLIATLDLTNCTHLTVLSIGASSTSVLSSLTLTGCTSLSNISISNFKNLHSVTGLLTTFPVLLNLGNNDLTSLDLHGLTSLQNLYLTGNANLTFASMNISGCTNLSTITLDFCSMGAVDFSGKSLTHLAFININNSQPSTGLTSLNITGVSSLQSLSATNNPLFTTISGLTSKPLLNSMNLNNNAITSIDISGLTFLNNLALGQNPLTTLTSGANNSTLANLYLDSCTPLSTLDTSHFTSLIILNANFCNLSSITIPATVGQCDLSHNVLTSISAAGWTGGAGYSTSSYYYQNFTFNSLSAAALNAFFAALGVADPYQVLDVGSNPGSATCNPAIANANGWTVYT